MRKLLPVVVAAALLAAGCNGDGDGEKASGTTTTAPSATTSSTAPTRIEGVLVALLTTRNKVFSAPDPARVTEYVLPECRCAEEDRAALEELKKKEHRWATPIVQVEGIRVAQRRSPDEVVLLAVATRPSEQIVDASNTQVGLSRGPGLKPAGFQFLLKRKDGVWKIAEVAPQQLPEVEIFKIMQEGIPQGPPDDKSAV
jgi:hypothetical protein